MLNHHHPLSAGLESAASASSAPSSSTSSSAQHQFPSSGYAYPQQHPQAQAHYQPASSLDAMGRPHLDTYYPSQQQQHPYAASYYAAPHHIQAQYASSAMHPSSLKRKSPGAMSSSPHSSSSVASTSTSPMHLNFGHDKLCDVCYHPDPVLFVATCGHLFHSRCVHVWPLTKCPVCDIATSQLSVLKIDMNAQIDTRSGKWTRAEEKFIDCILTEFDRNSFPLANGTPVRLVLAKLLNCSTMRLSKKFQKNALGKRTFRIAKPAKGEVALEFNRHDHVVRQKEFSRLEAIFRHELVEQYRRENNTDEGAYVETQDLRHAVKQFWVINFLKLAVLIGQPVHGLDVSDSKKKKQALLMLRNGQFDELLSWNSSPVNTPTISPMPHLTNAENTPWNGGAYGVGAHAQAMEMSHEQQPVKKMRTPESMARGAVSCDVDVAHFEIQPPPPMAPVTTTYEYGKTSPHSYAEQQHYAAAGPGYSRVAYGGHYASIKSEKHEGHQQPPHYGGIAHSGPATAAYRSSSYQSSSENPGSHHGQQHPAHGQQGPPHGHHGQQAYPWDELLDDISGSEPNAGQGQVVVDPALQAWSNLHIM